MTASQHTLGEQPPSPARSERGSDPLSRIPHFSQNHHLHSSTPRGGSQGRGPGVHAHDRKQWTLSPVPPWDSSQGLDKANPRCISGPWPAGAGDSGMKNKTIFCVGKSLETEDGEICKKILALESPFWGAHIIPAPDTLFLARVMIGGGEPGGTGNGAWCRRPI